MEALQTIFEAAPAPSPLTRLASSLFEVYLPRGTTIHIQERSHFSWQKTLEIDEIGERIKRFAPKADSSKRLMRVATITLYLSPSQACELTATLRTEER
jgi:hypothetical protein